MAHTSGRRHFGWKELCFGALIGAALAALLYPLMISVSGGSRIGPSTASPFKKHEIAKNQALKKKGEGDLGRAIELLNASPLWEATDVERQTLIEWLEEAGRREETLAIYRRVCTIQWLDESLSVDSDYLMKYAVLASEFGRGQDRAIIEVILGLDGSDLPRVDQALIDLIPASSD